MAEKSSSSRIGAFRTWEMHKKLLMTMVDAFE
jgi:hypothetical protein